MRISGVEITSDLDTMFILFSLPRLKQTQLSLICKRASLPPLFTPVLAFPNSFYLCSCAVQEESCQHNIHYYSDKNRVAFTSISQRQLYSLLQSSIKNRRRRANCHLAAESPNCLSLLQVDPVRSRGGNDLWSLFVMGQSGKQTSWCSINTEVIRSGTKEIGVSSIFHWRKLNLVGYMVWGDFSSPRSSWQWFHRISCKSTDNSRLGF